MAKAAGIEIVTAGELREKYEVENEEDDSEEDEDDPDKSAEYSDEDDEAESEDEEYQTASDEEHKVEGAIGVRNPLGKNTFKVCT